MEDTVRLTEHLSSLKLVPDDSFGRSMVFAWRIQEKRRESTKYHAPQGLSPTSVLLGAIYADINLKSLLEVAGLNTQALLIDVGLKGYRKPRLPASPPDDFDIQANVASSISTYWEVFEGRGKIDALGLTWGLLEWGDAPFLKRLKATGANPVLVKEIVGKELSTIWEQERKAARPSKRTRTKTEPGKRVGRKRKARPKEKTETVHPPRPTAPPKPRLHRDRWSSKDELGYEPYAEAFAQFIRNKSTRPPLVIGIQAPWGQGKTTLMRMIQKKLDPGHPDILYEQRRESLADMEDKQDIASGGEDATCRPTFSELLKARSRIPVLEAPRDKKHRSVWFNAWKYQKSEQIWAGLAHCILSQLSERLPLQQRQQFWLQLQLRRVDWDAVERTIWDRTVQHVIPWLVCGVLFLVGALSLIVIAKLQQYIPGWRMVGGTGGTVGVGILGTWWAWIRAKSKALKEQLDGKFINYIRQPDYSGGLGFLHLVEEDMVRILDLLTDERHPAVIFVDDLDRCSPKNVAEIIEAINLFLAGDFPDCIFILGLDAEVVAASMEVAHEDIVDKIVNRRGELGWRFMDKFIQLPFVIPRLTPKQSGNFLRMMFGAGSFEQEEEDRRFTREKADATLELLDHDDIDPENAARQIGVIGEKLLTVDPERAQTLQRRVLEAAGEQYQDDDPKLEMLFDPVRPFLTDNPRTIKRVVNLFRFQYFVSIIRQMQDLPVAAPEQLARWVVLLIRWPNFVRWIQAERSQSMQRLADISETESEIVIKVIEAAEKADNLATWSTVLSDLGLGDSRWLTDLDLLHFLKQNADVHKAGGLGVW